MSEFSAKLTHSQTPLLQIVASVHYNMDPTFAAVYQEGSPTTRPHRMVTHG
jgi:hypothetical protein